MCHLPPFLATDVDIINDLCHSFYQMPCIPFALTSYLSFCRYAPLDSCIFATSLSSSDERNSWPVPWPERLNVRYASVPGDSAYNKEAFEADTKYWKQVVSEVYFSDLPLNWSSIRNIMDMNAGFGG